MVAQHLVSQLNMVAVKKRDKNYIIEEYPHLSLAEMNNKCPCEKADPISGEKGDTSFGMLIEIWVKPAGRGTTWLRVLPFTYLLLTWAEDSQVELI